MCMCICVRVSVNACPLPLSFHYLHFGEHKKKLLQLMQLYKWPA